jgi:hypothetical protein
VRPKAGPAFPLGPTTATTTADAAPARLMAVVAVALSWRRAAERSHCWDAAARAQLQARSGQVAGVQSDDERAQVRPRLGQVGAKVVLLRVGVGELIEPGRRQLVRVDQSEVERRAEQYQRSAQQARPAGQQPHSVSL